MSIQVQGVRGVGCIKGYPYFATGLYGIRETKKGKLVFTLVGSGNWHRTTNIKTCGTFDGAVELGYARHNQPVTAHQASQITGLEEAVALDKIREMIS